MLDFESFHLAFKTTLDRFAPLKQKVVRNNNQTLMTKTLRKAILKRSKPIGSIKKEIPKIGPITNNNEIIVQIF